MRDAEIIIIGAGAAGLMASLCLAEAGKKVIILEAKSASGGRIFTYKDGQGNTKEAGAEFVHGDLPCTLGLLKKAAIPYEEVKGEMWQYKRGEFKKNQNFIEDWPLLMDKLNDLKEDMSMENFLSTYFSGEQYTTLRNSVKSFLEGYDAATLQKASALGMREEWADEEEASQYRIEGGYGRLVHYLQEASAALGTVFNFGTVVKTITWKKGQVEVRCENGHSFYGQKIIVTVPLGVLSAGPSERAFISFEPLLEEKIKAVDKLGFGAVIKVLLDFKDQFWTDLEGQANKGLLKEMGFLFSDAEIPTWWTQYPRYSTLLTGWLAGPSAAALAGSSKEEVLEIALKSLSQIFNIDVVSLKEKLISGDVFNWTADPFTRGAYSYASVKHTSAMDELRSPVEKTIYFSGEGLYDGAEIGTVEAALVSGEQIAKTILQENN